MASYRASGDSSPIHGGTVTDFMSASDAETFDRYRHLRCKRNFVQQLASWVVIGMDYSRDEAAWKKLVTNVEVFEECLTWTNASLPVGRLIKPSPKHAQLLVKAASLLAQKIGGGSKVTVEDFLATIVYEERNLEGSWATAAFHALRGTAVLSTAVVPVAFYCTGGGVLARLEVEVFAEGPNVTANHAEQILDLAFKPNFTDSMAVAFRVASAETQTAFCGRWRILPWSAEEALPDLPIDGPSMGAAAARAWNFALLKRKADSRVLVIAKTCESGAIEALNDPIKCKRKVSAVCATMKEIDEVSADAIDTIVVVGDVDASAAREGLSEDMGRRIRIVQLDRLNPGLVSQSGKP